MAFIYEPGLVGADINIQGTTRDDIIIAGLNDNIVSARAGDDYVLGQDGNDTLNGDDGDDFLFGENGSDTLDGNDDDDFLFGQSGSDSLTGGDGEDFLAGGIDADTLTGGGGEDIFFFDSPNSYVSFSVDTITDFRPGTDEIQVDSAEFNIGSTDFDRFNYDSTTGALSFVNQDLTQTTFAFLQPGLGFVSSRDIDILELNSPSQ